MGRKCGEDGDDQTIENNCNFPATSYVLILGNEYS